jgi:uncharacterized membrane protein
LFTITTYLNNPEDGRDMLQEIITLVLITFIPIFELRASIPYGILKYHMHWLPVFITCVLANIAVGMFIYFFLDRLIHFFIRWKPLGRLYHRIVEKSQKRIRPYVERYGTIGVALFIGVPLPGSGVYTAALGSCFIGIGYRRFFMATVIGVLIAAVAVTLITLFGSGAWAFFIRGV